MKFMVLVLIITGALVYARLQLAPSDVRQTIDRGLDTLQGMVEEPKPATEAPLPEALSPQAGIDVPIPQTKHPYQALIDDGIVLPGFGAEKQPAGSPPVKMAQAQDDAKPSPETLQDRLHAIQQQLLTAIEIVEGK
jgi:hypothetical protein